MSELQARFAQEKPLIIALCEVKPKNAKERSLEDDEIPGYSIHSVNLECNDGGRGIAVYTHNFLDKCIVHTQPELAYHEACLLEIKLRGGYLMLFGCFYRSPTTSITSDKNNKS